MNQNDIKAFLMIVRTGSLNQAANLLFITQPALSQQLKSLEAELETTLFNRKKGQRTLTLTTSGKHFYEIAQKYEALYTESLQLKHTEDIPSLSIGAVGSLNSCLFPPLYIRLSSMTPPVSLKLSTGKTSGIYQAVLSQNFDIGLVHRNLHLKDLDIFPVFREKMFFVCSREHMDSFTGGNASLKIAPSVLKANKEIYFSWSIEYNAWHEYWFGSSSRPHVYMDQTHLIEQLIAGTDHWAVVPAPVLSIFKQMDRLFIGELTEAPPPRICYAIARKNGLKNPSPTISVFLDLLYETLEQNPWVEGLLLPSR